MTDISKPGRLFLSRYLGFDAALSKKEKKAEFARKNYGKFKAQTQRVLGGLQGFPIDLIGYQTAVTDADALFNTGDYVAALKKVVRAGQHANQVLDRVDRDPADINAGLDALVIPVGSKPDEILALSNMSDAVRAILTNNPLSDADLLSAQQAFVRLEYELQIVNAAITARAEQRVRLDMAHAKAQARIDDINVRIARLATDAQHATLVAFSTGLAPDITALKTAADSYDVALITAGITNLGSIDARLTRLSNDVDGILRATLQPVLGTPGLTASQDAWLVDLGMKDQAAFDAATDAFADFDHVLNGADVDQADLVARAQATADAQAELDRKRAAHQAADAAAKVRSPGLLRDAVYVVQLQEQARAAHKAAMDFHRDNFAVLNDRDDGAYVATNRAYIALCDAFDQAMIAATAAKTAYDAREALETGPATQAAAVAKQELDAAEADLEARENEERCAKGKKKLLDAISYGALSPSNGRQVKDPHAAELIELFRQNPDVAETAVSVASNARHPESVVTCAKTVADALPNGFEADDGGRLTRRIDHKMYGDSLIKMSANIPDSEAQKLEGYLKDGRHFENRTSIDTGTTIAGTGKARVDYVGESMINADGSLNIAGGKSAMLDLMFHPQAIDSPSTGQVIHMLDTIDFLENDAQARAVIDVAAVPTDPGGVALLATASGKDAADVDANDTKKALLTAMMTPVYQGKVGSCFTTASLVKQRETDPLRMLEDLSVFLTNGVYEVTDGDNVAAIQNVPQDENTVLRSYEYSAATATAQVENSYEQQRLGKAMAKAVNKLGKKFKADNHDDVKQSLQTALSEGFTFVYDSGAPKGDAADGQSTQGGFKLVKVSDGQEVTSQKEFLAELYKIVFRELTKDGRELKISPAKLSKLIGSVKFQKALTVKGRHPWDLPDGGITTQAVALLEGGEGKRENMTPATDPATMDPAVRTKAILGDMIGKKGEPGDEKVRVGAHHHAFNMLANDPSMEPFIGASRAETVANIQEKLVQKGVDAAQTQLPLEQIIVMYDREMARLCNIAKGPEKDALKQAWAANTPTAPMTPQEFYDYVETIADAWFETVSTQKADAWRARQEAKGKVITDEHHGKFKDAVKEDDYKAPHKAAMTDRLIDDLGLPEVVIADTNWGSAAKHKFFVIAPNPLTGVPQLFIKEDPPGNLVPKSDGDEWLAAGWDTIV